jgi:hypothetical protein
MYKPLYLAAKGGLATATAPTLINGFVAFERGFCIMAARDDRSLYPVFNGCISHSPATLMRKKSKTEYIRTDANKMKPGCLILKMVFKYIRFNATGREIRPSFTIVLAERLGRKVYLW